jgi:hypothetical protein
MDNMEDKEAVKMIMEKFQGRFVDPNSEGVSDADKPTPAQRRRMGNEDKDVPLVKMFKCQGDNPGCGLSKPANEFYKEFNTLCSECSLKLVRKHGTDLYWVPLIINCYEVARGIRTECERLATPEAREAAWSKLVVNHEIDIGRNHFVKSMIEGTKRAPNENEWVTNLYSRFRTWMLKYYGIENTTNQKADRQ